MHVNISQRFGLIVTLLVALSTVTALTTATLAQAPKTLTIGVIGRADSPAARGVQLAIERFNNQGNTTTPDGSAYRLALLAQDATSPDQVTSAITTLKTSNVVAIFGPDDEALALASVNAMSAAGVPAFTAAQNAQIATKGFLFRTRADDSRLLSDLADYSLKDLAKSHIALFQGDPSQGQRVQLFSAALSRSNLKPVTIVLQTSGGAIQDSANVLVGAQPDLIVAFGADAQAVSLLQSLRSSGYSGAFAFPEAADREFVQALPPNLQAGIVGVSSWVYSSPTSVSQDFVDSYVSLFGDVPTARSAAAYDSAGALILAISKSGIQPDALRRGLLAFPKTPSIQGDYNPALGSNELSADVTVFTTGDFGAPVPEAQYDETGRITLSVPTATPTATPTPVPTKTPVTGVTATTRELTNVHSGPNTAFPVLGQLQSGTTVPVFGVSQDGAWLVIDFARRQGWIRTDRVTVTGNLRSVPVVTVPPTPTPSRLPFPDLRVINVVITPSTVHQGQPFTATITIINMGIVDSGQFAVAASWLPGNVYTAIIVPGLRAGATTTVNLTATVNGGTGIFTVAIVVDLNNQVNEGPYAIHKKFPFTYRVQ